MRGARASSGGLRFALLTLLASIFVLVPAANASAANFDLDIVFAGTGEGRVECEVESQPAEECEDEYEEGTEVALVAEEEPDSIFVEFSGDCGPLACELTMDEDHLVTATFDLLPVEEFTLTLGIDGTGSGTVECELQTGPEPCAPSYPEETEITLIPVPGPASELIEFSGDCEGPGPVCELTMLEDSTVTVTFDLIGPALKVLTAGSGSGTVKCSADSGPFEPCAIAYLVGTELVLSASASSGSKFSGWSGACTSDPCELTLEEDAVVTATFSLEPTPPVDDGKDKKTEPGVGRASVAGAAQVKGGKATLRISCKGAGPCKGTLKLVAKLKKGQKAKTVGQASFNLAKGASATLKVKLSAAAKKKLGNGKTLKAQVSGSGVSGSSVKLIPASRP